VRRFGLDHAFASHRAIHVSVLDIYKDRARTAAALHLQAMAAIEQDGAQALLLGCTGFSDLAADLRALMAGGPDVAVIEPLQTAVALAAIVAAARPGGGTG
jgi:allantoin racemase